MDLDQGLHLKFSFKENSRFVLLCDVMLFYTYEILILHWKLANLCDKIQYIASTTNNTDGNK